MSRYGKIFRWLGPALVALGCSEAAAPRDPGPPREGPRFLLVPYDTTTASILVAERTLTVPAQGSVSDTVDLFSLGAFADTAFLEGYSTIQADNGHRYPFSIVAGAGRIYYYKGNGELWYRPVEVEFLQVASDGSLLAESFAGSTPVDANPLRFRDTDAARHGTRLVLTVGSPVPTVWNANDPGFSGFCMWINVGSGLCAGGPAFGPDYIFSADPSGEIRIRAYSRGAPGLKMTLSRTTVLPVMESYFRAVTQAAGDLRGGHFNQRARMDTVRITLAPLPGGASMAGIPVWVDAQAVVGSGGHIHSTVVRPTGTFFHPGQEAQINDSAGGSRSSTRVVLDSLGRATLIYRTSGVSGIDRIVVRKDSITGGVLDTAAITIKVAGMVQLMNGGNVDTIGVTVQHPDAHWGVVEFVVDLLALADSIKAHSVRIALMSPALRPQGRFPTVLEMNDMSLPWGGLFDVDTSWSAPPMGHLGHRRGLEGDVRVFAGAADEYWARWLELTWMSIRTGHDFRDERRRPGGPHYHLYQHH